MDILEVKRHQLVSQSKHDPRYKRRLKCSFLNSSKAYDDINMSKLFTEDILEAVVKVVGETDTYDVIIMFSGVIEELKDQLEKRGKLDTVSLTRALVKAFDKNDVYIHCSCKDFQFRFNYWATIDRYNSGEKEMRPTNITNPDGDKGACCKHGLYLLNKQTWLLKIASVINNYIKYIKVRKPRHYENIIAPALYDLDEQQADEQDIDKNQISMFDKNDEVEVNDDSEQQTVSDDEV